MKTARLLSVVFVLCVYACDAPPPQELEGAPQDGAASLAPKGAREGEMCAGLAGIECGNGLYCSMDAGRCTVADDAGVCRKKPEVCTEQYEPVCGCDGKTYGNACQAEMAGAKLNKPGACST